MSVPTIAAGGPIPVREVPPDREGVDHRGSWWRRPGRPAWALPALGAVLALAAGLYIWNLSGNGMSNTFYAAAVKSGTESWKAFLFGSIDPGNFITVDKPPAALWVMELSGRIFGFSSWSMLLPEALAGVGSVYLLHRTVRRWAGDLAAVLAALALALTPVATVMFRTNDPDAFLTLLLVAAAAALWSALETRRTRWLVLCGSLVGLAFVTKMLEAFIVLPAFGLVYLICADNPLKRRIIQLGWAGLALVISSGWWVAVVELWPKASRPYVGGSTDNSELNLIFGYNGFSRVFGSGGPSGGAPGGGGGGFGGSPGWLRMFNDLIGGQISWLIPFALLGLLTGLWLTRRAPRTDRGRAGWILWGGWMVVMMAVFSQAKGILHPYYTVALAPPVAALAGVGAIAMWRAGRHSRWWAWVLPAAVIITGAWAVVLLGRTPGYYSWLKPLILGGAIAAGLVLALAALGVTRRRAVMAGAGVLAAASVLAGPAAYSLTTAGNPSTGPLASAGPATTGGSSPGGGLAGGAGGFAGGPPPGQGSFAAGGPGSLPGQSAGAGSGSGAPTGSGAPAGARGGNGGDRVNSGLVSYLKAHKGSAKYLVAVNGSGQSAPIILATGQPVVTMGGFNGSDPAPTLAQLQKLVSSGQLHYVLLGGGGPGGGGAGGGSGGAGGGSGAGGGPGAGGSAGGSAGQGGFFPGRGGPGGNFFPGGGGPGGAGLGAFGGSSGPGGGSAGGTGSARGGPGGPAGPGGSSTMSAIEQWVTTHGTVVPSSQYGGTSSGTLYYLG